MGVRPASLRDARATGPRKRSRSSPRSAATPRSRSTTRCCTTAPSARWPRSTQSSIRFPSPRRSTTRSGKLERMNAAAQREPCVLFTPDPEGRAAQQSAPLHRRQSARPPTSCPSMRALHGETVKSDYLVRDARTGDDRVVNLKAAPIRDDVRAHHRLGRALARRHRRAPERGARVVAPAPRRMSRQPRPGDGGHGAELRQPRRSRRAHRPGRGRHRAHLSLSLRRRGMLDLVGYVDRRAGARALPRLLREHIRIVPAKDCPARCSRSAGRCCSTKSAATRCSASRATRKSARSRPRCTSRASSPTRSSRTASASAR